MFQDIMREVKKVNVAVISTNKTYAQTAAMPPVDQKKTFITPERKQELEKAKKECKQYELAINIKNSPPQTLELGLGCVKDITARFQKVINNSPKQGSKPCVKGISRVGSTMLRLQFSMKEEAQ